MTANPSGVIQEEDVRAAQTVLDALDDVGLLERSAELGPATAGYLKARGILAAWSADVRTAGYLEGVQRGRQEAAHVVLDALQGEGLAP